MRVIDPNQSGFPKLPALADGKTLAKRASSPNEVWQSKQAFRSQRRLPCAASAPTGLVCSITRDLHEAVADEQHEQHAPARLWEEDGAGQEVKRGNKMLFSVWMCSITAFVSLRAPT